MALKIWLPLINNVHNQGASGVTITNTSSTFVTGGKIGNAIQFGTAKSYLKLDDVTPFHSMTECSISLWIKILSWNTSYATYFQFGLGTTPWTSYILGLLRNNTASTLCFTIANGSNSTQAGCLTPALDLNTWYHLTFTYKDKHCKIYTNGIETRDYTTQYAPNFAGITNGIIGACNNGSNYQTNCLMNDFRIYDHCLSAAEVKEIAQGLVLHYKLDSFQQGGNPNLLARYVVPGQAGPTSTANGGRTIWAGDYKITIPATENADTYFRLFMTEQLTANTVYTISCEVSGLLTGSQYNFPLFAQNNAGMGILKLNHNGLCSLTFTMTWTGTQTAATGADGETVYVNFLDDASRALASGQGPITLSNFKLEKGTSATAWCPSGVSTNIVEDSSGYNHNGTITGTSTISSNTVRYSSAMEFPGTAYIKLISPSTEVRTISLWAKWNTIPSGQSIIYVDQKSKTGLGLASNGILINTNQTGHTFSKTSLVANTWYHFVIVSPNGSSNATRQLYINGVEQTALSSTNSWSYTLDELQLGKRSTSSDGFNGEISDFRMYCTALDADAVRQLYEVGAKIDNKANFHTYEISENDTNKLTKTGIMHDNMEESIMTLPDGSCWQLLMFHYVDGGNNLFTSSNATNCNDFGLFSRLKDIDKFKIGTQYEFYGIQDGNAYRWIQTNAPLTTTAVTGFSAVSGYTSPGAGLCKCNGNTVLARTNTTSNWWNAVGCYTKYGSGIPGYAQTLCTRYMALYARIEKADVKISNQTLNASEIIEL